MTAIKVTLPGKLCLSINPKPVKSFLKKTKQSPNDIADSLFRLHDMLMHNYPKGHSSKQVSNDLRLLESLGQMIGQALAVEQG